MAIRAMDDRDATARLAAARDLGALGDPQAVQPLRARLAVETSDSLKERIAEVLKRLTR